MIDNRRVSLLVRAVMDKRDNICNMSVIAHVNHDKSTLTFKYFEATPTLDLYLEPFFLVGVVNCAWFDFSSSWSLNKKST